MTNYSHVLMSMNFAKLFPESPVYVPLPWLTIAGGLMLWHLQVEYEAGPYEARVRVSLQVPSVESPVPMQYERASVPEIMRVPSVVRGRAYELSTVVVNMAFDAGTLNVRSFRDAQRRVMDRILEVAKHEVLESLQVDGGPFYADEVAALHPPRKPGR